MQAEGRARQLAFAGDIHSAVALLSGSLDEKPEQPRLWLLLGELLAKAASEPTATTTAAVAAPAAVPNPSGLGSRYDGSGTLAAARTEILARAVDAYAAACSHGRRSGDRDVVDVGRECLQQLFRLTSGHSPAVLMEGLWDSSRSSFVVAEAQAAAAALRAALAVSGSSSGSGGGGLVACVVDGLGWEAAWLARSATTLGLSSVYIVYSRRGAALGPFARRLAEANGCTTICSSWEDLSGHLEPARPAALMVVLGSCLTAHPMPPRSILAEVMRLAAVVRSAGAETGVAVPAAFVPSRVRWVGGAAAGEVLRSQSRVDAECIKDFGLDFRRSAEVLRPRHARVILSEGDALWNTEELASLDLDEAWLSAADTVERSERGLAVATRLAQLSVDGRGSVDAVVWWALAHGRTSEVGDPMAFSCGPRRAPPRTWQVAVFGDAPHLEPVEDLLMAVTLPQRFRGYHVTMLNDVLRTAHYAAAVKEVTARWPHDKDFTVLDIGAGTGLLSMLLAKSALDVVDGKRSVKVVAVEAEHDLAELAKELIAINGLADNIEVLNTLSTSLGPGLWPERVGGPAVRGTCCIHEVFGSDPLSERMLPSLQHAQAELLSPDSIWIPSHFHLHCALCWSRSLQQALIPPSTVQGVQAVREVLEELSPVVEALFIPGAIAAAAGDAEAGLVWLSSPASLRCDLKTLCSVAPCDMPLTLEGRGGSWPAGFGVEGVFVAAWFSIDGLAPLDTFKDAGPTRPWAPFFQRLPVGGAGGLDVIQGDLPFLVDLTVRLLKDRVRFQLARVALQDDGEQVELESLFAAI